MSWLKKKYDLPVRRENKIHNTILVNQENKARREIVFDFNKDIKWLCKYFYAYCGKTVRIESVMNQVFLAIQEDSEFIIQNIGPELYRFKDILRNRDIEYFCHKLDLKSLYGHLPKYDDNLIVLIQKETPNLNKEEQEILFERINGILDAYMEYTIFEMIDPILDWRIADIKAPADPEKYGFRFIKVGEYKKIYRATRKKKSDEDDT